MTDEKFDWVSLTSYESLMDRVKMTDWGPAVLSVHSPTEVGACACGEQIWVCCPEVEKLAERLFGA